MSEKWLKVGASAWLGEGRPDPAQHPGWMGFCPRDVELAQVLACGPQGPQHHALHGGQVRRGEKRLICLGGGPSESGRGPLLLWRSSQPRADP